METGIKNNTNSINSKLFPKEVVQKDLKIYFSEKINGLGFKVEKNILSIYYLENNEFQSFPTLNVEFRDFFSNKIRTNVLKFLKSMPENEQHTILDGLLKKYQEFLNFKKAEEFSINELKNLSEKGKKNKKLEEEKKLEESRPSDILSLVEGSKIVDGKYIPGSKWDQLFHLYSFNNPEYSKISIHLLIGQCIIDSRIKRLGLNLDPRISIMYFKSSGSGGSAGYNIVAEVAKEINLKTNTVSSATDAAMIGSIDAVKDDDGNTEIQEIKGLLDKSKSNIIYWAEPEGLFEVSKNQHEGNIRRYIQSGLNMIEEQESTLERSMKNGTVSAKCEGSIILVTVPPQNITDKVIDSGFMQRFCFISKVVDINERSANAQIDNSRYQTIDENGNIDLKNKDRQNQLKNDVIIMLKHLKKWAESNKEFYIRDEAVKFFNTKEAQYFYSIKNMKNITDRVKEKLATFQQFTVRKSWQIAMHHAALRFSNIVEVEDIKYACEEIIEPQMVSIQTYLEESFINEIIGKKESEDEVNLRIAYFQNISSTKKTLTKDEFLEIMSKFFKKSIATVYRKYKKLIDTGIITEKNKEVKFSGYEPEFRDGVISLNTP